MNIPLTLVLTLLFCSTSYAKRVLIDPGHGGDDCGAKAQIWTKQKLKIHCEKDVALEISKQIKNIINKSNKHTAYLTRTIDKELSLDKRSKMADIIKADIFVSIHLNGSTQKTSNGFETYYLDNHKDDVVRKVERAENIDRNSGEELIINKILIDLIVDRMAPKSKELGIQIHSELSKNIPKKYKLSDRGVKPGMFYVLALSKRPSVLIEVGFLTNEKEAKLITDQSFQQNFAEYVASGVISFLDKNSDPNLF